MRIHGPIAENKDWARDARIGRILPALRKGEEMRLDFSRVKVATQSFVHALIAEAIHLHGQTALELLAFHRCSPQVQEAIKTVVTYSMRAREIAASILPDRADIRAVDVPQADDLGKVRVVVASLKEGPKPLEGIAEDTEYSLRHVHYRINAARILGLVQLVSRIAIITEFGEALLRTPEGSPVERDFFKDCLRTSAIIQKLAPHLLSRREPTRLSLATRMERLAKLAPNTAKRRAGALLSWRRYILESQLSLGLS